MTAEAIAENAPTLECDLVMKGGVTSGIIYPAAIAAIAKDYRLRSVGGTSAGAIGAAAAAAMEFGRRSGRNPAARLELAGLAGKLGKQTDGGPLLLRLFEPDSSTASLFRLFMRLMDANRLRGIAGVVAAFLLTPFLWASLLVAGLTGLLLWATPQPLPVVSGIALLLLFFAATPLTTLVLAGSYWVPHLTNLLNATAENGFGFCSGMARYRRADGKYSPSLSGWLHEQLQGLAGLGDDEPPLTFGDLWTASFRKTGISRDDAFLAAWSAHAEQASAESGDQAATVRADKLARDIELALVASDINRAQSVQLPFMRREDRLYARISDLKALFPDDIVTWIVAKSRPSDDPEGDLDGVDLGGVPTADIIRLPYPQDLPVLFGVRMSLSFPFLFKAVRLYLIRRRAAEGDTSKSKELAEIWLADGGITSNFPIHLFDAPIPERPTFCINLLYHNDELEPDRSAGSFAGVEGADMGGEPCETIGLPADPAGVDQMVYMLRTNSGRLSGYTRFAQAGGMTRLIRFGARIVTTARQWGDNQLIDIPGYRDRIVHVRMRPDEGGFNFAMGAPKIADLEARGTRAGEVIAGRFNPHATEDPLHPGERLRLNWANHRFVRFRVFLSGLEVAASRFATTWTLDCERAELPASDPRQAIPSIEQMVDEARPGSSSLPYPVGYPLRSDAHADLAHDMVKSVIGVSALSSDPRWKGIDYQYGRPTSPRPKSGLKLRPPTESDPFAEQP